MPNKLCPCGALATWDYAPAPIGRSRAFCDDCVPRGCSCNAIGYPYDEDMDEYTGEEEQERDERGRLLPCIEYDFDENGWPED